MSDNTTTRALGRAFFEALATYVWALDEREARAQALAGNRGAADQGYARAELGVDVAGPKASFDAATQALRAHLSNTNASEALTALDEYLVARGVGDGQEAYKHLTAALGLN